MDSPYGLVNYRRSRNYFNNSYSRNHRSKRKHISNGREQLRNEHCKHFSGNGSYHPGNSGSNYRYSYPMPRRNLTNL